jgi:Protein of unknown function (DUF2628)
MRVWTVHVPPPPIDTGRRRHFPWRTGAAAAPALVREGFSWGAFLFGPLWLLAHRLWLAALLWFAVATVSVLLAAVGGAAVLPALQFLLGCHARDLQRRALARRNFQQVGVVVERDEERALARLLAERPELAAIWGRAALA